MNPRAQGSFPRSFALLVSLSAALSLPLNTCADDNRPEPAVSKLATNRLAGDSYLRIARVSSNVVQLQVALRKFVPDGKVGPTIWLAAASHIGEPEYYRRLQEQLNTQTLVLFEGVGAAEKQDREEAAKEPSDGEPKVNRVRTTEASSMQMTLAKSLGLVFQLDAINYDRPNFRNSDMTIAQLRRVLAGGDTVSSSSPPTQKNAEFEKLLRVMDESSLLGSFMKFAMNVLGSSPKLQAMTKLILIEVLGQLSGDLTQLRNLPPDLKRLLQVLIEERNKIVIQDVKIELSKAAPNSSIAILYGAAHMHDLERRLARELNYRADDRTWLTAFSVDVTEAKLSEPELQMIHSLVNWQMSLLGP